MENTLILKPSQLMENRSAMARSVEEQGLRMVHLEKEGRQLEREVDDDDGSIRISTTLTDITIILDS